MSRLENKIALGVGNGAAAGALWGIVFLAPQVLRGFEPVQLSVARYLIYGVVALLLLVPHWRALPKLGRAEWITLVWLSLLGNIVYYVLLSQAVQFAGGAPTSLIIGLLPVVVTLWGAREDGALRFRDLLPPLALSCAGVGLISYQALHASGVGSHSGRQLLGFFCAFGALASWAAYAIGNSWSLRRFSEFSSHQWSLLTGLITGALALVMGVGLIFRHATTHSNGEWLRFWVVSAVVAILASVIGNKFWNQASRLLPLALTGQMIVFETLFALLYSFLWERRYPTALELLAAVCLVSGVFWCAGLHGPLPEAAGEMVSEAL